MDWMNAGYDVIKTAVLQYKGDGYTLELFLIMLIVMCFLSKKHEMSRRVVLYTVISIIILCNPIVAVVLQKTALHSVYWRTLWILPMGIVIAYTMVCLVEKFNNAVLKTVVGIVLGIVIITSGSQMMTSENFQKTENKYKIPGEVIEVADIILDHSDGSAKVIAPDAVSIWVREYTPEIELIYGRGYIYGYEGTRTKPLKLRRVLNAEKFEFYKIDLLMREWDYRYVVLEKNRISDINRVVKYGYVLLGDTNSYHVFYRM